MLSKEESGIPVPDGEMAVDGEGSQA